MKIVLNPSPFDEELDGCDLSKVSVFLVNEIEAGLLAGGNGEDGAKLVDKILKKYPEAQAVVTMGAQGAFYGQGSFRHFQRSFPVKAVDTTAAGDTFTGYFVYGLMKGEAIEVIMKRAAMAAAVAVSRKGAVPSIPKREEIKMTGE